MTDTTPLLKQVRADWRRILTNTAPIERSAAMAAVENLYLASGYGTPAIEFFASPQKALKRAYSGSLFAELMLPYRGQIFAAFNTQVGDIDIRCRIATDLYFRLHLFTPRTIHCGLVNILTMSGLDSTMVNSVYYLGGQDAWWLSAIDFALSARLLTLPRDLARWFAAYEYYASMAGWMFAFADRALICDRPASVRLNTHGRLHCTTGPALAFVDGSGIYAWKGKPIPKWAIEEPHKLTPAAIRRESDVEVRLALFDMWAHIG
jgi:hypothetical protein